MHLRDADNAADLGLAEIAEIPERDDAPLAAVEGVRGQWYHRTCEAELVDLLVERDGVVEVPER